MADGDHPGWVQDPDGGWHQAISPAPKKSQTATLILLLLVGAIVATVLVGILTRPKTTTTAATNTTAATTAPDAPAPTTAPPEPYVPVPTDFTIEVIELERSCFGSAGCNVTYTINPTYIGTTPPEKSFTVIYDVAGATSAKTGNFTVSGDVITKPDRDTVQTPLGGTLIATATRVLP